MTSLFSRDLLHRKPHLNHLQMPQLPPTLQVIPEEDESCTLATSSSCSSPIRPEKRTFSSSHIEVSFGDDEYDHDLLSSPRPAPRPLLTPPRCHSYDFRSGATSPTLSTSSSSSDLPSTPTSSDDEFPISRFISQRASIKPLNITKNYTKTTSFSSQEEASDDDESDSEWYTREFSKIISLNSPLSPLLPQQPPPPPRPESLLIEPFMTEDLSRVAQYPILVEPRSQPLKRVTPISHKRSRSVPKETPPPVPPIPAQFLSSVDARSAQASTPTVSAKPRPRSLSLRRPPPRTSIPDDCLTDDVVTGADESSWPSAFDISSYEHPSPAPSPAFISPSPSSSARVINRFTALSSVPEVPASPVSMYSQTSAIPRQEFEDFDAFEGFGEIEFAVDDVKFDLSIDVPMRLPLSLPNSPVDLETDFALGLEELRKMQEADSTTLVPPIIAISDADEASGQQEEEHQQRPLPELPTQDSPPLQPTPSTATSFDSYYASGDAEAVETTSLAEEEGVVSPTGHVLSSKWSSSTLASIHEEHASRSSKFPAARKLRLYFGGGKSPLSKYRHNQKHREQKQQQHKRSGSVTAIVAAKVAVARAATGAIHHSSCYPYPSSSTSIGTPTAVKKAQRQVVVVQSPPSPSFYSHYPRTPTKPSTPSTPSTSTSPPGSPFFQGKRKAAWSRRESDVMIIGYGYGGVGKLRRKGSLTPTVSDAGSEESYSSWRSNGLGRKPIPMEMFLRNANV